MQIQQIHIHTTFTFEPELRLLSIRREMGQTIKQINKIIRQMHSEQRINPEQDQHQHELQLDEIPKEAAVNFVPIRHPFRQPEHIVPIEIQTQCPICLKSTPSHLLLYFCCREHQFCKSCIVSMVQHSLSTFQLIKCPQETCQVQLSQKGPYFDRLKSADRNKWRKIVRNRQALENPQVKLCRRQECDGILKIQQNGVQCQLCKIQHCKKCLQVQHKGYCDKKQAKRLSRRHHFKMCPSCKMIVQKNKGCDHITCLCSFQFCYLCNEEYRPNHKCQAPRGNCLDRMQEELQRQNSGYNGCLHCGKILQFLTPDPDHSTLRQYAYIILFTITVYPLLIALIFFVVLSFLAFWGAIFLIAFIMYLVLYPLVQVIQLELPPSLFLVELGLPRLLVRILTLPLYPINLAFMVRRECAKLCEIRIDFVAITHYMPFFMTLPCLMFLNAADSE